MHCQRGQNILLVGQNTFESNNSDKNDSMASQKMRVLAKLLQKSRKLDKNIRTSFDLLRPLNFDIVVEATRRVTDYDESSQKFMWSHSTVLNLGFVIRNRAMAVRGIYLKNKEPQTDKAAEIDAFLKVHENEWHIRVSSAAHRQRQANIWKKTNILPLTQEQDVVDFNDFREGEDKERG